MDSIDLKVVYHLMRFGRMTWSELAGVLSLSSPAAADRVRRLEERGVITGYAAQVAPESLGLELLAFIFVSLDHPVHCDGFIDRIRALPEVQECHHLAGDDDYILKVRCRHTRHLEYLISQQLKRLPGVARTRTAIALSTLKETTLLPLPFDPVSDNPTETLSYREDV